MTRTEEEMGRERGERERQGQGEQLATMYNTVAELKQTL